MIAQDEIICRLAEAKLQGIEEGRAKGIAEGIAEAKRAAIIKALNRGKLTIEEISEDNDTSVEEVLKIKAENNL